MEADVCCSQSWKIVEEKNKWRGKLSKIRGKGPGKFGSVSEKRKTGVENALFRETHGGKTYLYNKFLTKTNSRL